MIFFLVRDDRVSLPKSGGILVYNDVITIKETMKEEVEVDMVDLRDILETVQVASKVDLACAGLSSRHFQDVVLADEAGDEVEYKNGRIHGEVVWRKI